MPWAFYPYYTTGEGSDMKLHTGGTEPPIPVQTEILQLSGSSLLLVAKTFGHLPWSSDVVHLLVKFMVRLVSA